LDASLSQLPNPVLQLIPQTLLVQMAVPFVPTQTLLQLPQWFWSAVMFTSQPSVGSPLQSAKPGLQLPMAHLPLLQMAVAFAIEHLAPQLLQLEASVFRFDSQPLLHWASQLSNPGMQVPVQILLAQLGIALAGAQGFPQALQFIRLLVMSVSQPVAGRESQSPKPGAQLIKHFPSIQLALAFSEPQTFPHAPQFATSCAS
jgi:hypothetical protein